MNKLTIPTLSQNGLSPSEVLGSRDRYGDNRFSEKKRTSFFKQYLESFGDPIIRILLVALSINIVFMFQNQNWFETAGIAIAVFLATFVSTLSEYGSEAAFLKLQADAEKIQCRVKRNSEILSIPIGEIVVGDLVLLMAGERIPADGIIISGELKINQAALNGESKEVTKKPLRVSPSEWDLSGENQLFRGGIVTLGEGLMQVCNVGDSTFYGSLARELQDEGRESPLKIRLEGLAKIISRLGYTAAVLVAFADLFNNIVLDNQFKIAFILAEISTPHLMFENLLNALILAVTVVVVAVPEGLPMMITVVLSSNMFKMLKDQVMVRKLVGIETSGNINILFTDKTGTLTEGNMLISTFVSGNGKEFTSPQDLKEYESLWKFVELSSFYNTASVLSKGKALGGNATDRALLNYVLPLNEDKYGYYKTYTIPFDSSQKFSAVQLEGGDQLVLVKGAPERLLKACTQYYDFKGHSLPLTNKSSIESKCRQMTEKSMRILLLATSNQGISTSGEWDDLTLIGLVGIRDELRPEVKKSVETVHNAGIQTVMITGDNRETAIAIAREAGIIQDISTEMVLTSKEMADLSDSDLKKILSKIRVIARALPEDKSRLVNISQDMGLVVGMTGDGINDSPALKKADVGFAMGSGTEVAKEASDIVILDDDFSSITKAILYGRTIFKSIRKFIVYQLTMNFCAVGVSLVGPFIGIDTPITVIQMLWINMIMDTLGALAFAGEPPLSEYMDEAPKTHDEHILSKAMIQQIFYLGSFTTGLCILFLKLDKVKEFFHFENDSIYFLTAFFALFVFAGIFNSFNARTPRINIFAHLSKNATFLFIMCAVVMIQLTMIYLGGSVFRTAGLTFQELFFVLSLAFMVIPMDVLRKILVKYYKKYNSNLK